MKKENKVNVSLIEACIRRFGAKSVRIIGFNVNPIVEALLDLNIDVYGIDNNEESYRVFKHNYNNEPKMFKNQVDLVWFNGVINDNKQYLDNVFTSFRCSNVVIMQTYHKGNEFWINEFKNRGFDYSSIDTIELQVASDNTTLVFIRNTKLDNLPITEYIEPIAEPVSDIAPEFINAEPVLEIHIDKTPIEIVSIEEEPNEIIEEESTKSNFTETPEVLSLKPNQEIIEEDGRFYIVTKNKDGSVRKGSKKLIIQD